MTPIVTDAATFSAALLMKFALGYFMILATPGPNMLAIGTMAALRGFRGVLPFCLGIACGAGLLAAATFLLFDAVSGMPMAGTLGRIVAGALLMALACRIMRAPTPRLPDRPLQSRLETEDRWAGLGPGVCIAATNPVTAAYCLAQFLGPLSDTDVAPWAIGLVALQALAFGVATAALFARPLMRRLALTYHRPVCILSGLTLLGLGLLMLLHVPTP
jgi:threonine/homoserine/homoserine lactone efflux protein